jgi:enoyl-CoA hydratase/carnithine racemase
VEGRRQPRPSAGAADASLIDFDKPLVAAVRGATIGGGAAMLLHYDFVYAGEGAKSQIPFINLAVAFSDRALSLQRESVTFVPPS